MAIIKIKNPAIDLDAAEIPNLPASKITSGTFSDARIADLSATKLTGSISDARLPANALNSNVDLTNLSASNLTSGTIPTARITALPNGVGGKILQVVSTTKLDTFSISSTGIVAVPGFSLSITPSSTSNKIFITSNFCGRQGDYGGGWLLYRDGSSVATPSSIGSRTGTHSSGYDTINEATANFSLSYLDSPSSTSSLTYAIYIRAYSNTIYHFNRSRDDTDTGDRPRTIGTITAYEIAG